MTNNAGLAVFRVLFGLLMVVECWGAIATGWVHETFVEPRFTFPLMGFEWLRVLSGPWMYGYFAVMGAAALGVALGYRYRASAFVLALMWTGAYLGQKSHYNNHYYLAVLIAWAMWTFPAHRRASLDVRRGAVPLTHEVDAWIPRLIRVQVLIVFSYAAIAKLYPGWLNGDYMAANLGRKGDRAVIGPLLVQPWFQTIVIWTAIVFDALVVPALMWRRTRVLAFVGLIGFNAFNSLVFLIGIFPYMVLAFTAFFFEPSTIERRFAWLLRERGTSPVVPSANISSAARACIVMFLVVQTLMPLRHHLFPGDVTWTEEGHRMSWRMMLRTKSSALRLVAVDLDSGAQTFVRPEMYLSKNQRRRVGSSPEFVLQFARIVRDDFAEHGKRVAIHARKSLVSLNGGRYFPLIDANTDLAQAQWRHFGRDPWVLDRPR